MICPRCSVGEISDQTHECTLCGFAPSNVITLATPFPRELEDSAKQELEHQFQIEGVLGRTARSVVYLALERAENRLVALKVLPRTSGLPPEVGTALQREIVLAASLDHPHILPVYRGGDTRVLLWYSMEYCNARSLADVLADGAPMDLAGTLRIVQQIASALDYAHRRGIAHGGLTPENVLIDARGWVRVSDFGVRRAFGRPAPDAPELRYLAPEHFAPRNLAGPSADQYALAVVTYDCLAGSTAGTSTGRLQLPPGAFDALKRATSEQTSARFATVLDFVAALEGTASPPAPVAESASVGRPSPAPRTALATTTQPTTVPRRTSKAPLLVFEEHPALPAPAVAAPRRVRVVRWIGGGLLTLVAAALAWLFWPVSSGPTPGTQLEAFRTPSSDSSLTAAPAGSIPAPVVTQPAPSPLRTPASPSGPGVVAPPPAARAPSGGRTGKLFIAATPWAELSIDGRLVGNTPKANLDVPAGRHRLRLQRDGFLPFDTTISVFPGATVRITDIVLRAITQ